MLPELSLILFLNLPLIFGKQRIADIKKCCPQNQVALQSQTDSYIRTKFDIFFKGD